MTRGAHLSLPVGKVLWQGSSPLVSSGLCGHHGNIREGSEHSLFQAQSQHRLGAAGGIESYRDQLGCHACPPPLPSLGKQCHSCFRVAPCFLTAPGVTRVSKKASVGTNP